MTVILHETMAHEVPVAPDADGRIWIPDGDLERVSGWTRQGQRLCKGDVSVPGSAEGGGSLVREGAVDVAGLWRHLEHPLVSSDAGDVWVLGTRAADRAAALHSLQAPDFTLPDLEGRPHRLSEFRGRKVFLVSWASW